MADLSLHKIELACPETRTVVGLLAYCTSVPEVQSLGGFIATWNLGKFALISNSIGPEIPLPSNMGQG